MTITQQAGFADADSTESFLMEAAATNLGGFTIQQDFEPEIENYLRTNTEFWQAIPTKKPAAAPIVRKIMKTKRPKAGFVNRGDLDTAQVNVHADTANDLDDPGQEVKAVAGTIEFDHFSRSMYDQQGRPYGDEIAEETDELLTNTSRLLEMAMFQGDSSRAGNLEFNGIDRLMHADNILSIDLTSVDPDSIVNAIDEAVVRATSQRNMLMNITDIWCTGPTAKKIREEVSPSLFYHNVAEVRPGIQVPGIQTANGVLPIHTTPYLSDLDGGAGDDTLRMYLIDHKTLEWHGVYPFGGNKTFSPQIFDITRYLNGQYLVEKRMVLMYGTTYAKNRGRGIWRIDIKVPSGTAINTGGYETLM